MEIKRLTVGELGVNCYLCACVQTGEAMVIDPGQSGEIILKELEKQHLMVKVIVNTHGHADHIGANTFLKEKTGAPLFIHEADAPMLTDPKKNLSIYIGKPFVSAPADRFLKDGDTITIGKETFAVLHTPGHTPGGISLLHKACVFTGDTLFAGSVGRTDFPGGSMDALLTGVREKLMVLGDGLKVYPGHGEPSSIGGERGTNPFLL